MKQVRDLPKEIQYHIFQYVGNPHGYRVELAKEVTDAEWWDCTDTDDPDCSWENTWEHWFMQWSNKKTKTICGMPKKPMRLTSRFMKSRIVSHVHVSAEDPDLLMIKQYDNKWWFAVDGKFPRGRKERRLYLKTIHD